MTATEVVSMRAALVSVRAKELLAYRWEIAMWTVNPALRVVLFAAIWRAVYDGRASVDGVALETMTAYVSMAALHTILLRDDLTRWVEHRVRSGVVAMDLIRPVGLFEQCVWGQVAQAIVRVPTILAVTPAAALFSGFVAPASTPVYALSAALGWAVNCCVFLLLASAAFWTLELGGMNFLFFVVNGFLSGAMVPLWFMPDWLRVVLEWLPFQATLYTPVAIYVGQITGADAWRAVVVQTAWLLLLGGAAAWMWRCAVGRVVSQGG
ncbi:MAG: ABC transporter permease [Stackebrandtia sp.]